MATGNEARLENIHVLRYQLAAVMIFDLKPNPLPACLDNSLCSSTTEMSIL